MQNYKKVIAFDFDNTLTRFNVSMTVMGLHETGIDDPVMIASILEQRYGLDGIFCDLMSNIYFINYLKQLKLKGLIYVIVTYGYKKIIELLLKKRGIYDIFSAIYSPETFGLKESYDWCQQLSGKNKMLEKVKADFNITDNKKILLIDDSDRNIDYAKQANYSVLHVVRYDGLCMEDVDDINKFIEANSKSK